MSEEGNKEKETKAGEEGVKQTIERRVVEHIIKLEKDNKPDPKETPPATGTEVSTSEEIKDVLARLKATEDEKTAMEAQIKKLKDDKVTDKDKLDQAQSKLEALALKELEEKKSLLVNKVRESQGDEKAASIEEMIQSGADVKRVERWLEIFEDSFKVPSKEETPATPDPISKVPTGKLRAGKPPVGSELEFGTGAEWVNHVYDQLEEQLFLARMGMPHDATKLRKYQKMATQLLKNLLDGEKKRGAITGLSVMQCPDCDKIILGKENACPECGHKILHGER